MKSIYSKPFYFDTIWMLLDRPLEVSDEKQQDSYHISYNVEFYLNQTKQLYAKVTFKIEDPPSQFFFFTIKIARSPKKKFETINLQFPLDISKTQSSSIGLCLNLTPCDFDDSTEFVVTFAHCFYISHLSGLRPVNMTCYMNSILQILYHIPEFRDIIYSIRNNSTEVFRQLYTLFRFMENAGANPPSNFALTKSFGWTEEDLFIQQDAQEFLCVFLDYIKSHLDEKDLFERFERLFYATQNQESKETHLLTIPIHKSRTLLKALNNAMYPSEPRLPELLTLMRLYHSLKKLITACQNDVTMPTEYVFIALAILNRDTTNNDQFITDLRIILTHRDKNTDLPYECAKFQKALSLFIDYKLQQSTDPQHSFMYQIYQLHASLMAIVKYNENRPDIIGLFIDFFNNKEIQSHAGKRNYFAKLPDILIFQLLSTYPECSQPTEYELELPMAKYVHRDFDYKKQEIQQDTMYKYELISVVVHQGKLSQGHYYSICRPTENKELWFKFDEQSVSLVKLQDVLRKSDLISMARSSSANMAPYASPLRNISVSRSMSSPTFAQSSPYLLVYCKKSNLKQIMKLRTNQHSQSESVQSILPRIDNGLVYVMTIPDIERLFTKCRFCFCQRNLFSMAKIAIEKRQIKTIDDLYTSVSQKYGNQKPFVLWKCISNFNPETPMVISDFGSGQTREIHDKPSFLFLQEIESVESIFTFENSVPKCNVFACIFFVFFFDPKSRSINFIGLCEAQTNAMVKSVYNPIRNRLIKKGIIDESNSEELFLYAERQRANIVQLSDSSTFQIQLPKPGYNILYVQFNNDCNIDFSTINLNYDDAKSFNSLNHTEAPSSIENYLLMKEKSINITFYRLNTNDHLTLRVPRNTTKIAMSTILYEYFHDLELQRFKENNSNYEYIDDQVLLALQPVSYLRDSIIDQYKASRINPPESTDQQPLQIDFSQYLVKKDNVQCFFFQSVISSYSSPKATTIDSIISNNSGSNHINVYFDFFPSITIPSNTQRIEISEDAILPSRRFQIIIPSGDPLIKFEQRVLTYQDVAQLIGIQPDNLNTESNIEGEYRIVMISQGKITKTVQPTDRIRAGMNIIRYEKIPDDQLLLYQRGDHNIQDDVALLRVIYAVKDQNNVVPFGIPFYIAITQDDSFESVTERICAKKRLTFLPEDSQFEFLLADSLCHVVNDNPPLFGDFSRSGYLCIIVKESVSMKDALLMQKYETNFVGLKIYA